MFNQVIDSFAINRLSNLGINQPLNTGLYVSNSVINTLNECISKNESISDNINLFKTKNYLKLK